MICEASAIPAGYMQDAKGRLVPEGMVSPQELLEDQTVRRIIRHAEDISAQIARFRGHTFSDVTTFLDLLSERYGAVKGGRKGNVTLTTYDGCMKVQVSVQDSITFGPELAAAKSLFDACISKWSEGANENIRVLVDHAFQMDQAGRINRSALFGLRRIEINDEEWRRAVGALNDSIKIIGSREYVRFYRRPDCRAQWQAITVDLATAGSSDAGEAA